MNGTKARLASVVLLAALLGGCVAEAGDEEEAPIAAAPQAGAREKAPAAAASAVRTVDEEAEDEEPSEASEGALSLGEAPSIDVSSPDIPQGTDPEPSPWNGPNVPHPNANH